MGSPENEPHRKPDEGPQHEVSISPFWISEMEIPWELYTAFMENGVRAPKTVNCWRNSRTTNSGMP